MKFKRLSIIVLFIAFCFAFKINVYAVTPETLASEVYTLGQPYGMTEAEKVKAERYVQEFNVTNEQAEAIYAKALEMKAILDKNDIYNLSNDAKNQIKNIAIQAADIVGATLVFTSNKTCEIYWNGVQYDTATLALPTQSNGGGTSASSGTTTTSNGSTVKSGAKLVYTGNNIYKFLPLPVIAFVILKIILRKKNEN